jgi:LssY C-terminus
VKFLIRTIQRVAILGLGVVSVWLTVFVFHWVDRRVPFILAVGLAYGVAAYVILPRAVRISLKILHRKRVPRFTTTADGLLGDPVNLALIGTVRQLRVAYAAAGWAEADPLSLRSSWRMARAFIFNEPYPTAPFSTLYLFGRSQDVGFQQAIGDSPRKRHHVRFWAKSLARAETGVDRATFWRKTARPNEDEAVLWVGAGTKDTGFSLTKLTFQVTHATDPDTDAEREYIINQLIKYRAIESVTFYKAGDRLPTENTHYITDGEIAVARLVEPGSRQKRESPKSQSRPPSA